ncbi:MAG: tetratricopeptide repeat protein [Bryobacteraceae bacterium]
MILIAIVAACARTQDRAVERLGLMPIENLSSDARLEWPSRAAVAVVAYDLAGSKQIFARPVDSLTAAQSMQASRLLEGYFFERNGRIGIRATLEDLAKTKAVESFEIDGAASAGFLPLANELARRLSSDARTFSTSNENAFRFYGEALSAKDSKGAEQALQQATGADPGFAAGYMEEAELLVRTGDRAGARRVAEAGGRARLDPIDRANLEYVASTASDDLTDRMKALELLTAATPANANTFRELGELQYARRQFRRAATEYRVAASLDPENPQIWNQLGYTLAFAKDLKGAREALAQYQRLAPGDANALDSQGEVSYMLGDFKSASEYFERAAARNPAESLKAAEARLMLGDLHGADALYTKYGGAYLGQWEYLTGRRKAGVAWVEKQAQTGRLPGDSDAFALSQLSLWKLEAGDRKAAADLATQAANVAMQSPRMRILSLTYGFVAADTAGESNSKIANAYRLLFAKKFQEALPWLQAVYGETNPSADGQVRTLLAWAYVETGEVGKAVSLTETYPLPLSFDEPLFGALVFPRFLYVRGAVLQQQGKRDEARKSYELYLKYAGDLPDEFGDEAKARASLAAMK